jgi:hypothetical protein
MILKLKFKFEKETPGTVPFGQKIETVERIVRRSLVRRCAAI